MAKQETTAYVLSLAQPHPDGSWQIWSAERIFHPMLMDHSLLGIADQIGIIAKDMDHQMLNEIGFVSRDRSWRMWKVVIRPENRATSK